jgi:hypothetical protein
MLSLLMFFLVFFALALWPKKERSLKTLLRLFGWPFVAAPDTQQEQALYKALCQQPAGLGHGKKF